MVKEYKVAEYVRCDCQSCSLQMGNVSLYQSRRAARCNVGAESETYLSDGDEVAIDSQDGSRWTVCDQSSDDIGDGGGAK